LLCSALLCLCSLIPRISTNPLKPSRLADYPATPRSSSHDRISTSRRVRTNPTSHSSIPRRFPGSSIAGPSAWEHALEFQTWKGSSSLGAALATTTANHFNPFLGFLVPESIYCAITQQIWRDKNQSREQHSQVSDPLTRLLVSHKLSQWRSTLPRIAIPAGQSLQDISLEPCQDKAR